MRPSGSDLTRWAAVTAAAVLLAGCASDGSENAAEPGVVLSSESAPADDSTADAVDTLPPVDVAPPDDDPLHDDTFDDEFDDDVLPGAPRVVDEAAEIEVEDQRGDGRSVRVEEVRYSSGTGIVGIYDAGLDLVGWAVVPSGSAPVTIQLDRRLGSSQELNAVLHRDDGDGVLDSGDPVLVEEGEQVSEDFDYLLG